MNLFEIDFLKKMETLLKEAFKFKKYKAMSPVLATFTGILMLPLVLASFTTTAFFAILAFFFSVLSAPIKFLHEIVNTEGKNVKHATQAIVYLVSWPMVFFLYLLLSGLLLLLLPAYAVLSIQLYAWSLGGFKFHLFPNKVDDISIEVKGCYNVLPIVFIIVGGVIVLFIPFIHGIIHFADLYANYKEREFLRTFFGTGGIYSTYISIQSLFAYLYSFIGFARHPKVPATKDEANEELAL